MGRPRSWAIAFMLRPCAYARLELVFLLNLVALLLYVFAWLSAD